MAPCETPPVPSANHGVTVIGLGATGSALAASLSLQGHRVTLYGRNHSRVQAIRSRGGLRISGSLGEAFVPVPMVTSDLEVAMQAPLVLISVLQSGHAALANAMGPFLRHDHAVLFLSGGGGSLEAARIWRTQGLSGPSSLGETSAPAHSARLMEDGTAVIRLSTRNRTLRVAAFPADRTSRLMRAIEGLFSLRPAAHVLEVALCNANTILHPLPMLLNLGTIEVRQGRFDLMADGMSQGVLRAMDAHDEERMRLLEALGAPRVPLDALFEELGLDPRAYREGRPARASFGRIENRFLAEDTWCGTALMASLGRMLGVPTPVSDAILHLASCLRDEPAAGRTGERLGIAGLNRDGLADYLRHGPAVPAQPASVGCG